METQRDPHLCGFVVSGEIEELLHTKLTGRPPDFFEKYSYLESGLFYFGIVVVCVGGGGGGKVLDSRILSDLSRTSLGALTSARFCKFGSAIMISLRKSFW